MPQTVIAKAKKLMPDAEYIYSLYDFSIIWLQADIMTKYDFTPINQSALNEGSLTMFDIFKLSKSQVNQIILSASNQGIIELPLDIIGKGQYLIQTKNIDFRQDGELYRVGKILKMKKQTK